QFSFRCTRSVTTTTTYSTFESKNGRRSSRGERTVTHQSFRVRPLRVLQVPTRVTDAQMLRSKI
ncbi:hypothetical protein XENOCAPTIV_020469, partial [Xenoophorus captivus]